MAKGRSPFKVKKDVPSSKRSGGTSLEDFANGIPLNIVRPKGSPTKKAAERAKFAQREVARLKEQKKQLMEELAAAKKEQRARENERFLDRQDANMMDTQEAFNAQKAAEEAQKARRQASAKKAAFTRELNRTIADVKARREAKVAAEQEAKRQAKVTAERQARVAELKAAHDNYIFMRRNDAITFADEAGIPAREFLESADDSAIEFWALSTRPKPGGFESARLEQLRKEIDPQNLEKLDLLVGRYKEFAKKRTGAGGAPEGTDRFDPAAKDAFKNEVERIDAARANTATPESPVVDTKAWKEALSKTIDDGKAIGSFLWKWGLKKPGGYMIHHPRRALAAGAGLVGGGAGYAYYRGSKQDAETAQEVANIKANMEQARQGFEAFTDDPGDLSWINELPSDSSAETAAKALADKIDEIKNQMGERYKGFSSGAVDKETLQKVQNLWAKYDEAGENTNARRWGNMKEALNRYRPEYYALLTGDSEKQAKIFHEIDDAMKAQAGQAGGGK